MITWLESLFLISISAWSLPGRIRKARRREVESRLYASSVSLRAMGVNSMVRMALDRIKEYKVSEITPLFRPAWPMTKLNSPTWVRPAPTKSVVLRL